MPARELRAGEELRTQSGAAATVASLVRQPGSQPVFNLEVETEHVYFVGEAGVLVHNACPVQALVNKVNGNVKDVSATIFKRNIKGGSSATPAVRGQMQKGDDAGHIIGKLLGGRGDLSSDNIFSQNPHINRGAFRDHEAMVRDLVEASPDGSVSVQVRLDYDPATNRVNQITYDTYLNGSLHNRERFGN